ncbi:MAG: hypothetical protein ACKOEM_19485, partial [Planctomycetia bacterium]
MRHLRFIPPPLAAPLRLACLATALTAGWSAPATAEQAPAAERATAAEVGFLRLSRDDTGAPMSLDTSIVRYRETPAAAARAGRRTPVEVDLVGAVHLGGKPYYDTLDRVFRGYDAVLYELVAPDNARVPKPGRKPAGAIGAAQQGMTRMLGLDFQLERVDYTAQNFVHADLSPREFDEAMARRGESWWSVFARLMAEAAVRAEAGQAAAGPELTLGDVFGLMFGAEADRQVRLRRLMAEQFSDMEVLTAAFGGEKGSKLITDRNAAALEILRDRIAAGDSR